MQNRAQTKKKKEKGPHTSEGEIPELLGALFRELHSLFTFIQQVAHATMFVRVEGDLLQRAARDVPSTSTHREGCLCVSVCACVLTSSLNWLLSHMDLKLRLFSKSVIFIFNCMCVCKGGGEKPQHSIHDYCMSSFTFCQFGTFCVSGHDKNSLLILIYDKWCGCV